jgi:DNA sulfur modification protein DndE
MKLSRIKISNDVTIKLRQLQGKTGLTPNILLRIGFGLSLIDKSYCDPIMYPEDGMELNRYTVTGEYDIGYVALLREWLYQRSESLDNITMCNYFRAHLNRGALLLYGRVKSLMDLALLEV